MEVQRSLAGVNMESLADAFAESEDVLCQMLALFSTQAPERLAEVEAGLERNSLENARKALHSLVNIAGAIRAYGLADLAKAVGDCLKRDELEHAEALAATLRQEVEHVLRQVERMRAALAVEPQRLWVSRMAG